MTLEQIEARAAEIATEVTTADEARCGELDAELEQLAARRSAIMALEQRQARLEEIRSGAPRTVIERRGPVVRSLAETLSSEDYARAYLGYFKSGDDSEVRSLLTGNVSGGTVPVPQVLETEIKNAWEDCKFLSLAKRTSYKGNVQVGFEYSATGAAIHVEGTNAPEEEKLVWGIVELKAQSIKKWITVSDDAIENTTVDTLGQIYAEIAQRIVEKAEEIAIGKIIAAPAVSSTTACGVPTYTGTCDVDDATMACAELSGKAKTLHAVMNRRTHAAYKAKAKSEKYGLVDPLDGIPVIYTDALPAFSAASAGDTYAIIGDIGYGFQVNFPSGYDVTVKVDDLSLAEKDLVKLVGRQFCGMGVVAPKAFVKLVKGA